MLESSFFLRHLYQRRTGIAACADDNIRLKLSQNLARQLVSLLQIPQDFNIL